MYNAANHFIDRHADRTSGNRIAYTDYAGDWTYQQLVAMVNQAGNVLSNLGLKEKQRVLMCMTDSVLFPAVFWGAIKISAFQEAADPDPLLPIFIFASFKSSKTR